MKEPGGVQGRGTTGAVVWAAANAEAAELVPWAYVKVFTPVLLIHGNMMFCLYTVLATPRKSSWLKRKGSVMMSMAFPNKK